jgi:hypothetical protein
MNRAQARDASHFNSTPHFPSRVLFRLKAGLQTYPPKVGWRDFANADSVGGDMKNYTSVEPLETRIAPAAIFTFIDVDGDAVTVKTSKGTNADLAAVITTTASFPSIAPPPPSSPASRSAASSPAMF